MFPFDKAQPGSSRTVFADRGGANVPLAIPLTTQHWVLNADELHFFAQRVGSMTLH